MKNHSSGRAILTINAGSSSIKFSVFLLPDLNQIIVGQFDGIGGDVKFKLKWQSQNIDENLSFLSDEEDPKNHQEAIDFLIHWIHQYARDIEIVAVGHRVVHGGQTYSEPVLITNQVMEELDDLRALAPLHQPHNIAGIKAMQKSFSGVPQIACFDTAFHRTHSFVEDCYAIPRYFYEQGVCRYGFHGLSYEYIANELAKKFPKESQKKVIIAHLGNGASMTALYKGISVASTMGFSSLDGLPMGTRCGEIDPGVLLYMMQHEGLDAKKISEILYKESGLKGLSGGISNDMRTLEASDQVEAKEAIDYYVREIKREIGALTALMAGLDVFVFTGGIGENSSLIRERVLSNMQWLGIRLDEDSNLDGELILSSDESRVLCLKIPTNEELVIAQHTLGLSKESIDSNLSASR